jgi:hypothetical protein
MLRNLGLSYARQYSKKESRISQKIGPRLIVPARGVVTIEETMFVTEDALSIFPLRIKNCCRFENFFRIAIGPEWLVRFDSSATVISEESPNPHVRFRDLSTK